MSILSDIFTEEFQTIKENLKDVIYEETITYAANKLLTTNIIRSSTDLYLTLESIGSYIDSILVKDDDIVTEDDIYKALTKYISIADGIIESLQYLQELGLLEAINWRKVAKYGAGLALAGLGAYGAYNAYQHFHHNHADNHQHNTQSPRPTGLTSNNTKTDSGTRGAGTGTSTSSTSGTGTGGSSGHDASTSSGNDAKQKEQQKIKTGFADIKGSIQDLIRYSQKPKTYSSFNEYPDYFINSFAKKFLKDSAGKTNE